MLKKQDPALLKKADLSSLRTLFLAGEPLDEPTAAWIADALGKPVIDNYWQTETGWPMLAIPRGVEALPTKLGSPGVPSAGFNLTLRNELTGEPCAPGEKGVLTLGYPLPPGCMSTVWGDDKRFVSTYWSSIPDQQAYSTFDWGIQDEDGYVYDPRPHRRRDQRRRPSARHARDRGSVVEPCGGRGSGGGRRDGCAEGSGGNGLRRAARRAGLCGRQGASAELEAELTATVDRQLGAIARPARVVVVSMLPKTRSGKLLRRAIAALAEGREPGDLPTIEDPAALQQVREALG